MSRGVGWACIGLPLVIAALVLWLRWPDSGTDPVNITASGPVFTRLDDLVAASDLVVIGTIASTATGRIITNPTDPTVGIRTTLYTLSVETVLTGQTTNTLIIEHETALLDGTPITINGTAPPSRGERGLYFLVAGSDTEFANYAIISAQGRYRINGNVLSSTGTDSLSQTLNQSTITEVTTRITTMS